MAVVPSTQTWHLKSLHVCMIFPWKPPFIYKDFHGENPLWITNGGFSWEIHLWMGKKNYCYVWLPNGKSPLAHANVPPKLWNSHCQLKLPDGNSLKTLRWIKIPTGFSCHMFLLQCDICSHRFDLTFLCAMAIRDELVLMCEKIENKDIVSIIILFSNWSMAISGTYIGGTYHI
jgi:hypothetical protein